MKKTGIWAVAALTTFATATTFAADLPGKGISVTPVQSTISEESFQTELVSKALEKLGYDVQPTREVDYNVGYTTLAAGDALSPPSTGHRCMMKCTKPPVVTKCFTVKGLT